MDSLRVCFRSSTYIEQFLDRHPLQWLDRELAVRGGPGDKAGATPTPAVQEFLDLANRRPGLFSCEQYITHCIQKWHAWYSILAPLQRRGVVAKLKNNFYPAMIDTLHAQAILIEARVFDYVLLDLQSDVEDKVDLVLRKRGRTLRVALVGPGERARENRTFKLDHRPGQYDPQVITIAMPWDRPKSLGNKRWFKKEDFRSLLAGDLYHLIERIRNGK